MTRVLYQPKGRAGEYAPWAVNLYRGCPHWCLYCYAPITLHMTRAGFYEVRTRSVDVLAGLYRDLSSDDLSGRDVLLCFTCDPYPEPLERERRITREAIKLLHNFGQHVRILTKAGALAQRDFDLLGPQDAFGVTLTCFYGADSRKWEPGAALPVDRLDNLQEAHRRGIPTWASMEPVIYPEQSLELIRLTHQIVDEYRLGVLNYAPHARTIDWADYGQRAVALLRSLGKRYKVKRDLQEKML